MKKYLLVSLSLGLAAALMGGCSGVLPEDSPQQRTMTGTGQGVTGSEPTATAPSVSVEPEGSSAKPEDSSAKPEDSGAESVDSSAGEAGQALPFYGTWEVKDFQIQVGTEYALSTEDMEAFRGVAITYQADSVVLDGEKVSPDNYTYETDDTAYDYDSLEETYGANLGEWWNNVSEVTHITIGSGNAFFGDQFFIVDSDTIWVYYEDVFFLAKRSESGGNGQ